MSEGKKTLAFAGTAAVLVLLAAVSAPRYSDPEFASDQGQPFYADFKEASAATSLEIFEYNESTASVHPFKVELKENKWRIPSHHGYPADAKGRLLKTAESVMDLRKDEVRSDNAKDHEEFGVIDPFDEKAGLKGRGNRVTMRDKDGKVLADFIFGKETGSGSGKRYVRIPAEKRTYVTKTRGEISAKFEDWIETDLLQLSSMNVRKVDLDRYSFDEETGQLKNREMLHLSRDDSGAAWRFAELKEGEEVNAETVNGMASALDDLKIVGIRQKPPSLTSALQIDGNLRTREIVMTLAQKGYFVTKTNDVISNEGEIRVACDDGVVYKLRFGEVLVASGEALTAGAEEKKDEKKPVDKKDEKKGGTENRYLFVTASFDEALIPALPAAPAEVKPDPTLPPDKQKEQEEKAKKDKEEWDQKKKDREKKVADGKKRSEQLTARFAPWFYVISADLYKKLRVGRTELAKPKEAPKPPEGVKPPDVPKPPDPPKEEKKPSSAPPGATEGKPEEKKPEPAKPADAPKPPDAPKPEEKKPPSAPAGATEGKPEAPKPADAPKPTEKKPEPPKSPEKPAEEKKP